MRRVWAAALLTLFLPTPALGQAAATLPLLDESYAALERLAAFGLVPRGLSSIRPFSRDRVAWLARDARGWLAQRQDLDPGARADLEALLDRLDARLALGGASGVSGKVEAEGTGGSSPGVPVPENEWEGLDAVLNPLWAGRGGRAYADRIGAALSLRADAGLGSRVAVSVGGRASGGSYAGALPGRRGGVLEALSARVALGRLAIQAGRDGAWTATGPHDGALLGANGPPLDLVRVTTDRPIPLHLLGDLDLSLFAADLGPRESFPHAKLFGVLLQARPTPALGLGLTLLNKQMGEGAPPASASERVADILGFWGWLGEGAGQFSDKSVSLAVDHRGDGYALLGEMTFTDVDPARARHTLSTAAAYRAGLSLPRLGRSGRHTAGVEVSRTGFLVYRHKQFTTGAAVDGYLQGGLPGPDSRAAVVRYGYDAPADGWRVAGRLTVERRRGGVWWEPDRDWGGAEPPPVLPDESRARLEGSVVRDLAGGLGGVEFRAALERGENLGQVEGVAGWNRAVLVRVWRAF